MKRINKTGSFSVVATYHKCIT